MGHYNPEPPDFIHTGWGIPDGKILWFENKKPALACDRTSSLVPFICLVLLLRQVAVFIIITFC